ncbi:phage tail protein [Schinkia sp. CFF1]
MIELKAEHIEKLEIILGNTPKQIPIVAAHAINRAAETARTAGARLARENYKIKSGSAKGKITIKKAYPSDLLANFRVSGRPISLINFKIRPNQPLPVKKRYVHASNINGSGGTIKKSFIATTKKGYKNVFTRVGDERNPLRSLHGPSLPQMYGREEGLKKMEKVAADKLDERLEHEIKRFLEG